MYKHPHEVRASASVELRGLSVRGMAPAVRE